MSSAIINTTINLAVLGVGLVGSEFISQVLRLSQPHGTLIRLISVSSSKKLLVASSDASIAAIGKDWKSQLEASQTPASVDTLLQHLKPFTQTKGGQRGKTVLVDNTSSPQIASSYPSFLKAGIWVVTPNKKAFSGSLELWEDILKSERERGARVLNEATVGAGLPIIAPLKELIGTGDEVVKIEGVFSGTLSYIFNEFSPVITGSNSEPSFSSIVKIARESGYTEPNPADDLSGSDVSRKLTILSRLIPPLSKHLPRGFEDVSTTSLVPEPLQTFAGDGGAFVEKLGDFDAEFDTLRKEATAASEVLRYVGVVDVAKGVVKASLERYPRTHPFATSLKGSDNIILFYTKRYGDRPLIVQGAGAGAAVTAMGVLGDVLKLTL